MNPSHGLGEDGGFDVLFGARDLGSRGRARLVAGNLVAPALYALALAVTRSADAAFWAVMLSVMTGAYGMQLRILAPLVALALIGLAVWRRRPTLFAWAGASAVVACIVSLDFGAFTLLTVAVAALRHRALRPAATGVAAAGIPFFVVLAAFGIVGDFFRTVFVETPRVAAAYVLEPFTPPALMKPFPDVLAVAIEPTVFLYVFWCVIAVVNGVMLARRPRRRFEPLLLLCVWIVLSAISYAERHHLRFGMLAAVIVVWTIQLLWRKRSALAIPALFAAIALAAPTTHLAVVGWMRQSRGPVEEGWVEVRDVPRARGAWFRQSDAADVASVRKYLALALGPDETFFDFTNRGILYYLTRRDCPVREYEVAFYETDAAQREVIRRIETNPTVRAALVPASPQGRFTVDGIPNATRAPLVWEYLRQHFEPDFEEGEVVFWRRK